MSVVNETLKFYYVNTDYADFLRDKRLGDACVPYTDYPKRKKFFIGIIFQIEGINYFAPISSNTDINPAAFCIMDKENVISTVRVNFMFPVIDDVYKLLDIQNIKDIRYKRLIEKEYRYCNKFREQIRGLAREIYLKRTSGQMYIGKVYIMNFKKLEIQANKWLCCTSDRR